MLYYNCKRKEVKKMTVRELIEKLQKMPQDADVYRYNTEEDRWYSDHTEEIYSVTWDPRCQEVVLK